MIETFLDNHSKINRMAYTTLGVVGGLLSRLDSTLIDRIAPRLVNDAVVFPYHPVNNFVTAMERFMKKEDKGKLQAYKEDAFRDYMVTLFPYLKGGQNGKNNWN